MVPESSRLPWNERLSRSRRRTLVVRPNVLDGLEPRVLMSMGPPSLVGVSSVPTAPVAYPGGSLASEMDTPLINSPVEPDLLYLDDNGVTTNSMAVPPGGGLSPALQNYDSQGRVGVTISATDPQALVAALQAMGGDVTGVAEADHMMDVFVPIGQIPNLVTLTNDGLIVARAMGKPQAGTGSVDSGGDQVLEADRVRAANGLSGAGETVGIMSDSFNVLGGYAADVASGDLPNNVTVLQEGPSGSEDEGRAMSQIVADLAPSAHLDFDSAFYGQTAFASGIEALQAAGANVIADDIFYYAEPFYQNGVIGQAINTVTSQGVVYASLAGNLGNNAYENTAATWTSDSYYNDPNSFLNFGTVASPNDRQSITLTNGQAVTITLEWNNPFYNTAGDTSQVGIYLANTGGAILAGSNQTTAGTGQPYQTFSYQNTSGATKNFDLLIYDEADLGFPAPGRLKWVNFGANNYGPITVNTSPTNSPTIISHGAASNAISVAAAPYWNQSVPETYSSFGPMTILYSPDGTTTLSTPQVMAKPDVTGVDGVKTTFFPSTSNPYFYGTSAATPHVAAIAALYLQAHPGSTPAQVKQAIMASARAMTTNANTPTATASVNQVGAGLVDAYRAVNGPAIPMSLSFQDGFDTTAALSNAWSSTSRFDGQTQVTTTVGPVNPVSSPNQLVFDTLDSYGLGEIGGGVSEANLNVASPSGSNGNDVGLSFSASDIGAQPSGFAMPASFTGFVNATGVAISADGSHWYKVSDLSTAGVGYALSRLNISSIAAAAGISLSSGFQLRFQAITLNVLPNQGFAFDNVRVTRLQPTSTGVGLTTLAGFATAPTTLATFSDGPNPQGTYTASINWGDAGTSAGTVSVSGNTISVSAPAHTYATGGTYTYTITLTDTATGRTTTQTGTATVAADVSSQVAVTSSGYYYQRSTKEFLGSVTITNTGAAAITGSSIALAFTGLPGGVTLDPTLTGYALTPDGTTPYLLVPISVPLPVNQSLTITVRFVDPTLVTVNYVPKTFLFS